MNIPSTCHVFVAIFSSLGLLTSAYSGEGSSNTGGVFRMTLNEAIIKALSLDPTVRKIAADTTEARGYSKEVHSDLLPQLRIEGDAGYANRDRSIDGVATGGEDLFSRRVGLVFEQLLWDGGFHWYRWKDAKDRTAGKELLEKAQREQTALGATEVFLDVIRARKQIGLAQENLKIHEKIRDLAKDRAQAAGNEADITLSQARYDLARTLVKERQLALKQAEARFKRYVGHRPPPTLVESKPPVFQAKQAIDPTENFHYQAALKQRSAAQLARKAVKKRYHPRVLFRGGGGVGEDVLGIRGEDNEVSALVVVQWDLWDSGRRKGMAEQALADIDRQEAIIDETLVLLNQDIESRWEDYATLAERISILRAYSSELNKTVKLYDEQFELGTRPLLSVLDIQNEEISSKIRLADEERDYDMSGYRLASFGGRLIKDTVGEAHLTIANDDKQRMNHKPDAAPMPTATVTQPQTPAKEKKKFNPFGFLKRK